VQQKLFTYQLLLFELRF